MQFLIINKIYFICDVWWIQLKNDPDFLCLFPFDKVDLELVILFSKERVSLRREYGSGAGPKHITLDQLPEFPLNLSFKLLSLQKGSLLQRIMGLSIPHVESNGYPANGGTRSVADGTAAKVRLNIMKSCREIALDDVSKQLLWSIFFAFLLVHTHIIRII